MLISLSLFQLPHGLPPTCLDLKTEVEKRFLRDPAWLPVHDVDDAFHKFLKYETHSEERACVCSIYHIFTRFCQL